MRRLWVAVGLLVAVTLVVVVGFSGVFGTRQVEVVGVKGATAQQVEQAAAVPIGRPLARIDTGAIAGAVEQAIPELTAIEVQRRWPHTVRISASPRTVAANVKSGGTTRWVDPAGVMVGPPDQPQESKPLLVLVRSFDDDEQAAQDQAVRDGLAVLAALPPQVRKRLVRIEARSSDDIVVVMTPGRVRVRWGSADDSARKAAVLAALLSRKASVYDVSAPDLPTTRGKEPRKAASDG
jgi:cell division protein FtsQ